MKCLQKRPQKQPAGSWLNQPIWKIWSSNWKSSPNRGEHKKYLNPPPSQVFLDGACFHFFSSTTYILGGLKTKVLVGFPPLPTAWIHMLHLLKCTVRKHTTVKTTKDLKWLSYCWWFRNPAITSWYDKYPIIYRVWDTSQVVGNGISEPSAVVEKIHTRC